MIRRTLRSTLFPYTTLFRSYNRPYSDERLIQVETILNSLEIDEPIDETETKNTPVTVEASTDENHSEAIEPNDELVKQAEIEAEQAKILDQLNLLNAKVLKN